MLNHLKKIPLFLRVWVLVAIISTIFCALAYTLAQQVLRMGANDPQIQLAEDVTTALNNGKPVDFSNNTIDIANSLSPFAIIFNDSGTPINGSAKLNGKTPVPPSGVLDFVRMHKEDRLTWQPQSGVRIASVVTRYTAGTNSGFVLVGRNMREVEARESRTLFLAGIAWLASLVVALSVCFLFFS